MSDQLSEFAVNKREVHVVLQLSTGRRMSAHVHCAVRSDRHHGRERVKDVLNGESPMFPAFSLDDGRWVLINKAFIELVELDEPDLAEPGETDLTEHREVEVTLASGVELRGTILVSTPPDRARTLDFLNRGERFFYLETERGSLVIGLAHVLSAGDAPPSPSTVS